jgi:16S rRNA G1207 methylase RsmC
MAHYYDKTPKDKMRLATIQTTLRGVPISLLSASGLFSVQHIDPATRLLIENAEMSSGANVLDLGCGYGVVGIMMKTCFPDATVTMVDINQRAVAISKKNAKRLELDVEVLQSNICEELQGRKFDVVLTNPPYAAGRDICFGFIEGAHMHLRKKGTLQLVARHTKGGKVLSQKMQEVFGNMEEVAKKGGFRVYRSIRK